jgi:hypothetical protein
MVPKFLQHCRRRSWAIVLAACLGVPQVGAASDHALTRHMNAMTSMLGAREQLTLEQIPDLNRRLLALRAYVRAGEDLQSRWSWSNDEIREYQRSREYQRLLTELDRVRIEFERRNPGYTLYVNTQVRSLDLQLERWNSNPRVGKTADNLGAAVRAALAGGSEPTAASLERFRQLLATWRPHPVAPLAAPGLSSHGRMRAVDFAIMRNGRLVASTSVATVGREWEAPGWDRKLKEAIVAAGTRFEGPLKSPNEPWHYEYLAVEEQLNAANVR